MAPEYLQLGGTVVVAITALEVIKWIIGYLGPKKNGKTEHPLCPQIISLAALFEAAEKGRTEKDAIIHNGLNTNANAIKDLTTELEDFKLKITNSLTALTTELKLRNELDKK